MQRSLNRWSVPYTDATRNACAPSITGIILQPWPAIRPSWRKEDAPCQGSGAEPPGCPYSLFVVGAPREHSRRNELSRHDTVSGTRHASETARTCCHAQRQWTRSIARMRSMATSDPDPLRLHVCSSNVYKDEPGTTAGGVTSHRSVASFGRILPSLKGR